jgi:hypothetical protein
MTEILHIQPWQMRKLTPWQHDAYVERTRVELEAREKAHAAAEASRGRV